MFLKFRSLVVHDIGSLTGKDNFFPLHPNVTIIRGRNGAGKTTVLEALAMVGHCPVIPIASSDNEWNLPIERNDCPLIQVEVSLNSTIGSDLKALVSRLGQFIQNPENSTDEQRSLTQDWAAARQEIQDLADAIDGIPKEFSLRLHPTLDLIETNLTEHEKVLSISDLKRYLSKESSLAQEWRLSSKDLKRSELETIKRLFAFSRPELMPGSLEDAPAKEKHYSKTLRNRYVNAVENVQSEELPPFVCYVNTDMYEFGIGLDVRESPKDLNDELAAMLLRLGVIRNDCSLRNFDQVCEFWVSVLEKGSRQIRSLDVTDMAPSAKTNIKMSGDSQESLKFLSSGENQVFFLGMLTASLDSHGCCYLLDEPDLHTDLSAARKVYEALFASAIRRDNQLIIVSHLPLIFRPHLEELVAEGVPATKQHPENPAGKAFKLRDKSPMQRLKEKEAVQIGLLFLERDMKDKYDDKIGNACVAGSDAANRVLERYRSEYQLIASQANL